MHQFSFFHLFLCSYINSQTIHQLEQVTNQAELRCTWPVQPVWASALCFFHDPALLPSGQLGVSRAAEENTHVASWKRAGTRSLHFSPAFTLTAFLSCFLFPLAVPHGQTHPQTDTSTDRFFKLFCYGECACVHFFSIPLCIPLLLVCLFMLLLLFLRDIFRDELQSTAGGEKN